MTATTTTLWVCDRCETKTTQKERGKPNDWADLLVVTPPEASPERPYLKQSYTLCNRCVESLARWKAESLRDER